MNDLIREMLAAWHSVPSRHAMIVHLPIALALLGLLPALAQALWPGRGAVRAVAVGWFLLLSLAAYMAAGSGDLAQGALAADLPADAFARVDAHERLARPIWIGALVTAVVIAVAGARPRAVRLAGTALGVAGGLVCAGWTAAAAHHGGVLVYEFGAGTPRVTAAAPQEAPSPGDPGAGGDGDGAEAEALTPELEVILVDGGRTISVNEDPRHAFFETSVMPLLGEHCLGCHNPRRARHGFDVSSIEALLRGGDSGRAAVVPGRPEESLMAHVLRGTDEEIAAMPPKKPLPEEAVAAIERWIREGAVFHRAPEDNAPAP